MLSVPSLLLLLVMPLLIPLRSELRPTDGQFCGQILRSSWKLLKLSPFQFWPNYMTSSWRVTASGGLHKKISPYGVFLSMLEKSSVDQLRSLHPTPEQLRRFRPELHAELHPDLSWTHLHLASPVQRANHFPGSYHLGRKDLHVLTSVLPF